MCFLLVALRKESVDRNRLIHLLLALWIWSLSVRRAWIEMVDVSLIYKEVLVALRKESVDRNMWWGVRKAVGSRRSP